LELGGRGKEEEVERKLIVGWRKIFVLESTKSSPYRLIVVGFFSGTGTFLCSLGTSSFITFSEP